MLTLFPVPPAPTLHEKEPNGRNQRHGPDPQDRRARTPEVAAEEDLTVRPPRPRLAPVATAAAAVAAALPLAIADPAAAQLPLAANGEDLADAPGEAIYAAACANCHGLDGTGLPPSLLAFEEEVPDFTDCDFAAREPDADWIAVAHEGGPVRGFSEMMPAFRGALTEEQLGRVMGYIRTLCTDDNWPRGELNLPRPLLTEKAYPEDEWVVELGVDLESDGGAAAAYVYEQRFGPRSQVEIVIPYGWRSGHADLHDHDGDDHAGHDGDRPHANDDDTSGEGLRHGLGDVVVGVKHALHHDLELGRIFSVGGEVILSTGDEGAGLGAAGSALEAFASFGQILPDDGFIQAHAGFEVPLYSDGASEGFGRVVLGRSFTEGQWGRTWTPMLEMQLKRHFESGAATAFDLVPQVQVALNTRQHVLANFGLLLPVTGDAGETARSVRLVTYLLLDWFDGGFFEGW